MNIVIEQSQLLPLQVNANNGTHQISGWYYSADANVAATNAELSSFNAYVPKKVVAPVSYHRGAVLADLTTILARCNGEWSQGGGAESGICIYEAPFVNSAVIVESYVLASSFSPTFGAGLLIHEWGHALDNHYGNYYPGGPQGGQGLTSGSALAAATTIQTLWNRVVTNNWFGNGQGSFYAWTNIKEFWAEAFRWHYLGVGGAGVTQADHNFQGQISGIAAEGSDDSFCTQMRNVITGLTAPVPSS